MYNFITRVFLSFYMSNKSLLKIYMNLNFLNKYNFLQR